MTRWQGCCYFKTLCSVVYSDVNAALSQWRLIHYVLRNLVVTIGCSEADDEISGFDDSECEVGCAADEALCNSFNDLDDILECSTGLSFVDATLPTFVFQDDDESIELCCLSSGTVLFNKDARDQCLQLAVTVSPTGNEGDDELGSGLDQIIVIFASVGGFMVAMVLILFMALLRKKNKKKKPKQELPPPVAVTNSGTRVDALSSDITALAMSTSNPLLGPVPTRQFLVQELGGNVRQSEVPEF